MTSINLKKTKNGIKNKIKLKKLFIPGNYAHIISN